jgi:predicted metal-dependent RNase
MSTLFGDEKISIRAYHIPRRGGWHKIHAIAVDRSYQLMTVLKNAIRKVVFDSELWH